MLIGHPLAELVDVVPHTLVLGVEQMHTIPETKRQGLIGLQGRVSVLVPLQSQNNIIDMQQVLQKPFPFLVKPTSNWEMLVLNKPSSVTVVSASNLLKFPASQIQSANWTVWGFR